MATNRQIITAGSSTTALFYLPPKTNPQEADKSRQSYLILIFSVLPVLLLSRFTEQCRVTMPSVSEKHKLTAILKADVQSYSRLMGEDETFTVQTLFKHQNIFSHHIENRSGRVINTVGDSILAELPSVVDAVQCAIEIQEKLSDANADLPSDRRLNFRIGINLDDVIHKSGDIYGDGVNIAARVESLAEGGGICITQSVYDRVKKKLSHLFFTDLGRVTVKNISEPVRVYRIGTDPEMSSVHPVRKNEAPQNDDDDAALVSQATCIAVLPFENFSGKKETDYFTRGFGEDLITDLSHFSNLQVISSYTSSKISAALNDGMAVVRQLGIDYLLIGNLRRRGDQIRISAQLIDASGGVIWAERYDAPLDTIFDIQDDIVERVVGALSARIDKAILAASRKKPATSLVAYDCWLQGMEFVRQGTEAADKKARAIFKQALTIDPDYSRAYAGLSLSYFNEWSCQVWDQWDEIEQNAYQYALKANGLDDTDHVVQMVLGRVLMYRREYDLAEQYLDRSLALNANDADTLVQISTCKTLLGDARQGDKLCQKAMRLNPYRKIRYHVYDAFAQFALKNYEACSAAALKGPLTDVWVDLPGIMAAAYAYQDDMEQATHHLNIFLNVFKEKINGGQQPRPEEIIEWNKAANPFKDAAEMDHLINGYIKAGLTLPSAPKVAAPDDTGLPSGSIPTCQFIKDKNRMWRIAFDGRETQLPEVKGFIDLAYLLGHPGEEVHCTELMGSPVRIDDQAEIIDEKARREYEQHLHDLQKEIAEAGENNDVIRKEKLMAEQDQLVDHLSKALGLGKRTRRFNAPVERARAAVTWRIRSAIGKIESVHPTLAKHLKNSIRTGTFCSYSPEKPQSWQL